MSRKALAAGPATPRACLKAIQREDQVRGTDLVDFALLKRCADVPEKLNAVGVLVVGSSSGELDSRYSDHVVAALERKAMQGDAVAARELRAWLDRGKEEDEGAFDWRSISREQREE